MTSHTEHVLVEATKSMSLQSDFVANPKDESWLGTCSFARSDGVNDLSFDGWRKAHSLREAPTDNDYYYTEGCSPHWHIVSDLRHDTAAAQREFVRRAKSPRFYFSIPVRDHEGTVIGSLAILDDKPRYGVSAMEMSYCEDLGDTIAQHLQSSIFKSQRQRSERLIQALGVFNNGGSSLREWWVGQDNNSMSRGGRGKDGGKDRHEQDHRFDAEFGAEEDRSSPRAAIRLGRPRKLQQDQTDPRSSGESNQKAADDRVENDVSSEDFSSSTATSPDSPGKSTSSESSSGTLSKHVILHLLWKTSNRVLKPDIHSQVSEAYSRASQLLRESMGAFGVAIIDAGKVFSTKSLGRNTSSGSSDDGEAIASSDTDMSDPSVVSSSKCKTEAVSTQAPSAGEGFLGPARIELPERDLAKLIKAYPRGKIFSFKKDGSAYSSSDGQEGSSGSAGVSDRSRSHVRSRDGRSARVLRKTVGDSGSIAFYPIWDVSFFCQCIYRFYADTQKDDRERWRSVLLVWTKSFTRFFHPDEDLTYMSAFAHCLRAELARIETIASDVAKGRFITSVSHELRSPLHGILAGIEMLQDSPLSAFQEEMAVSVALAGRTLLDT